MKKIFLFITVPFIFLAALPAQITEEKSDSIVLERLSQEAQTYTVYAKEGVQPEMTIVTSAGETLELDYECWVYYIRYTADANQETYFIVKESNGSLLEVYAQSNAEPDDLAEWRVVPEKPILICNVNNPLTDLPWLKEIIDKYERSLETGPLLHHIIIYQCIYKNGIGFLFYEPDMIDGGFSLVDCAGEPLCSFYTEGSFWVLELEIDFKNKILIKEIQPDPPVSIDNLSEQDLPIIQKFVQGKWKLGRINQSCPVTSAEYYQNTFVDISENLVVMSGDDNIDYSNYTFSYSWKRMEVHHQNLSQPIVTYVMWNDEENRGEWFFQTLQRDALYALKFNSCESYNLKRIRW